jgi:O-antigen ligase
MFWILINIRPKYRLWIAAGTVLCMIVGITILLSIESISTMMFVQGWARRDEIWPAAIQAISYHPWSGYGISSGDAVKELLYQYTGQLDAVHSTPLSLAFRAGIPTAVLWFVVFSMSFIRLIYSKLNQTDKSVIVMGLIGTFTACMFTDYSIGGAGYGSFVSTIFLGLANITPFLQPSKQAKQPKHIAKIIFANPVQQGNQ